MDDAQTVAERLVVWFLDGQECLSHEVPVKLGTRSFGEAFRECMETCLRDKLSDTLRTYAAECVAQERERCARIADQFSVYPSGGLTRSDAYRESAECVLDSARAELAAQIADAIRQEPKEGG